MPPARGRGRGRGGGRWANRATSTRGGSRVAKSTPAIAARGRRRNSFGKINNGQHQFYDHSRGHEVHAIFNPPGLLIIAGLRPEHFPDYDSEAQDDDSDSHSDYGSVKTPAKKQQQQNISIKDRLHGADDAPAQLQHAPNLGNDDDWTETEVEVFVEPKTRGFYRPPAKREVVRKLVKKSESSRYNDSVPRLQQINADDSEEEHGEEGALDESSQKTNKANDDALPVIVEHEATENEDGEQDPIDDHVSAQSLSQQEPLLEDEAPLAEIELVDEGELSDSCFPEPFRNRPATPPRRACEDEADWIMRKRFAPMSDPQAFIAALTKLDPASRSTEILFDLALNAQQALLAWQDEYLELDKKTAPASNPAKKPLTGGRTLIDPLVYEDMLEADLYGYNFDSKKLPGYQDPFRQRSGAGKFVNGRELRQRRAARDVIGESQLSDAEVTGNEGYGTRRRRAAQRGLDNELQVPPRTLKRTSSGGFADVEGPPRKRGRPSAVERSLTQSRVHQLRDESVGITTSDGENASPEPFKRRGRPPGSKNTQPRSDAGIKKGPRKAKLPSMQVGSEATSQDGDHQMADAAPTPFDDPMQIDDDAAPPAAAQDVETQSTLLGDATAEAGNVLSSTEPTREDSSTPVSNIDSLKDKDPKKRVRSEKRSKSMTEWWAARKAKAAEDRKHQLAQQAEADRQAEEQARAAHAAHQAQFQPQDPRYWPHIAPQAQQSYVPHPLQQTQHIAPGIHPPGPPLYQLGPPPPGHHVIPAHHHLHPPGAPVAYYVQPPGAGPPSHGAPTEMQRLTHHTHALPQPSTAEPLPMPPGAAPPPPPPPVTSQPPSQPQAQAPPQPQSQAPPPPPPPPPPPATLPPHSPPQRLEPVGRPASRQSQSALAHILGQPSVPKPPHVFPYPTNAVRRGSSHARQHSSSSQQLLSSILDQLRPSNAQKHATEQRLQPPPSPRQNPTLQSAPQNASHQSPHRRQSSLGMPPQLQPLQAQPPPPRPFGHRASSSLAGSPPQQRQQLSGEKLASSDQSSPIDPSLEKPGSSLPGPPPPGMRGPSPLRRIFNYQSDPSKAAQPGGTPYQSIIALAGSGSPNDRQPPAPAFQVQPTRPESHGSGPPAEQGTYMSAFHSNKASQIVRPPIPGTGSFRPSSPSSSKPNLLAKPPKTQGYMTGAQVQDLALAGAQQNVQRKSLDDVLRERGEQRPPPWLQQHLGSWQSVLGKQLPPLQAARGEHDRGPPRFGPPPYNLDYRPDSRSDRRLDERATEPRRHDIGRDFRPPSLGARPPSSHGLHAILNAANADRPSSRADPMSSSPFKFGPPLRPGHQLPPIAALHDRMPIERPRDSSRGPATPGSAAGRAGRERSISAASLKGPLRMVDVGRGRGEGERKG